MKVMVRFQSRPGMRELGIQAVERLVLLPKDRALVEAGVISGSIGGVCINCGSFPSQVTTSWATTSRCFSGFRLVLGFRGHSSKTKIQKFQTKMFDSCQSNRGSFPFDGAQLALALLRWDIL